MKQMMVVLMLNLTIISLGFAAEPATVFVVNEYSFDYATNPDAPEVAQSLCGTRCNSISGSISGPPGGGMMSGGTQLLKTASDKKVIVDIAAPFIEGKCICIGDEYSVSGGVTLPEPASR